MTKGRGLEAGGISSLNENINFEIESPCQKSKLLPPSRRCHRDLLLHLECMPYRYPPWYLENSAITRLHSYGQAFLLSVNLGSLNVSDKCHSTVYSLRGICFLDQKNTQATMPTTMLCFTDYSFSQQEKDIHSSNRPTAPRYRHLKVPNIKQLAIKYSNWKD